MVMLLHELEEGGHKPKGQAASLLRGSLTELQFDNTKCVSGKRAYLVGSFLKEDNTVREVVLSYNHMGTSGVEVIAGALKRILDD